MIFTFITLITLKKIAAAIYFLALSVALSELGIYGVILADFSAKLLFLVVVQAIAAGAGHHSLTLFLLTAAAVPFLTACHLWLVTITADLGSLEVADRLIALLPLRDRASAASFRFVAAPPFSGSSIVGKAFAALPHRAAGASGTGFFAKLAVLINRPAIVAAAVLGLAVTVTIFLGWEVATGAVMGSQWFWPYERIGPKKIDVIPERLKQGEDRDDPDRRQCRPRRQHLRGLLGEVLPLAGFFAEHAAITFIRPIHAAVLGVVAAAVGAIFAALPVRRSASRRGRVCGGAVGAGGGLVPRAPPASARSARHALRYALLRSERVGLPSLCSAIASFPSRDAAIFALLGLGSCGSLPIYGLLLAAPLAAFLRPARPTAAAAGLLLLAAALTAIVEALAGSGAVVQLGGWLAALGLAVEWCFAFDGLAAAMFVPIVGVSLLVQLYSVGYMGADPGFARFMGYLAFFTFAMILLVVADNMLLLFLGWEAVGVASYLLINFWFTRVAANLAALKAFLLNRVGDLFLAWAAILALAAIGDASYGTLLPLAPFLSERTVGLIAILLVGAASAKSALAVLGIHVWLPAAMEGPTPVSALIHAATMVTAGIYLFCRFGPLLEWCSGALLLVVALGAVGAIGGAVGGLLEADIKRVVAYSTVSQLGYMAVAAGASHHSLALFHLANHAFFKALLFLTAGAVIHAVADEQDMRRMGGLVLVLPGFHAAALLGSLSLMAFPFLTGFYSKDLLLELAAVPFNVTLTTAFGLLFAAAFFTALYSVRLTAAAFLQAPAFPSALADGGDEAADRLITLPLLILAVGAAGFGFVAAPLFRESAVVGEAFAALPHHALGAIGEPAGWWQKLPLILLLVPLAALPVAMRRGAGARMLQNPLAAWNEINGHAIAGGQAMAVLAARYFDRGLLELAGPLGLVRLFHFLAFKLELAATGYAAHYALILLGVAAGVLGFYAGGRRRAGEGNPQLRDCGEVLFLAGFFVGLAVLAFLTVSMAALRFKWVGRALNGRRGRRLAVPELIFFFEQVVGAIGELAGFQDGGLAGLSAPLGLPAWLVMPGASLLEWRFTSAFFGQLNNSNRMNPLVTPYSTVPRWCFLIFYAILRAILGEAPIATTSIASLGIARRIA